VFCFLKVLIEMKGGFMMRMMGTVMGCCVAGILLAASAVSAQVPASRQYSAADVEAGSKLYKAQCQLCHGPNGDSVSGINLRRGQFHHAVSDDDVAKVITTGVATSGMPAFSLGPSEVSSLIAYIRAGFNLSGTPVRVGDAARGKQIFSGKGGCSTCHRVNGVGPYTAPDLSDIGNIRSAAALQRSLTDPNSEMTPMDKPVTIVTRDGKTYHGRRLNEDTFTVQIIDDQGRLRSFTKADLKKYEIGKTSPMPPATGLTSDEQADLIGYLLTLKEANKP
jgi:cytochrome c oxidase cbb3-type subunit III